jgi:outer membrane protein
MIEFFLRAARPAALLLAGSASVAGSALAQTLPFEPVEAEKTWTLDIGGGAVYGFTPGGDDPNSVNTIPWGSFSYRDRLYANGLDGIGYNIVKRDDLRAGVQLRPAYSVESTLEGLDNPDMGADAAVYAFQALPGNFVIGGRIARDVAGVSDGTSFFASLSRQDVTRVGLLQTTLYGRGGDDARTQAYLGVTLEESQESGIEAFRADGGVHAVGAAALLMVPLGEHYGVGGFVNYERATGSGADSPLTELSENGADRYRWGLLVVRRFSSAD